MEIFIKVFLLYIFTFYFQNFQNTRLVTIETGAELNWTRTFFLDSFNFKNLFFSLLTTFLFSARIRARFHWTTFENEMISFVLEPFVLVLELFSTWSFSILCFMFYALSSCLLILPPLVRISFSHQFFSTRSNRRRTTCKKRTVHEAANDIRSGFSGLWDACRCRKEWKTQTHATEAFLSFSEPS